MTAFGTVHNPAPNAGNLALIAAIRIYFSRRGRWDDDDLPDLVQVPDSDDDVKPWMLPDNRPLVPDPHGDQDLAQLLRNISRVSPYRAVDPEAAQRTADLWLKFEQGWCGTGQRYEKLGDAKRARDAAGLASGKA